MICRKCGKELADGSRFCIHCGAEQGEGAVSFQKRGKRPVIICIAACALLLLGVAGAWRLFHSGNNASVRTTENSSPAELEASDTMDLTKEPDIPLQFSDTQVSEGDADSPEVLLETSVEDERNSEAEKGLNEAEPNLSAFTGEWEAADDFYPVMEITHSGGGQCQITITHKFAKWEAIGEYDGEREALLYSDGIYSSLNHGSIEWEVEETDCSGWIFYESPDALRWFSNDDDFEQYFIRTGSPMDEMTLNDIGYREAITDGWGNIWAGVAEHIGSETLMALEEEAEADPSLYGSADSPWYDITIDGITYEMALKHGWGDKWMAFAEHIGTGG